MNTTLNSSAANMFRAFADAAERWPTADPAAFHEAALKADASAIRHLRSDYNTQINKLLVDACKKSGLSDVAFWENLNIAPATAVRLRSTYKTKALRYSEALKICSYASISFNKLFWGDDTFPITLPKKHITWLRAFSHLSPQKKTEIIELLYQEKKEQQPTSEEDLKILAYRRLQEAAANLSIHPTRIIYHKYPDLWISRYHSTSTSYETGMLSGSQGSFLIMAMALNCSPDYFLCLDYSGAPGGFINEKGKQVQLDRRQKEALSLMLQIADQDNANELIGYICAQKAALFEI